MTPVEWTYIGSFVAYSLVEYWLGKTDKTKGSSVVEVALNAVKLATSFIHKK